MSSEKQGIQSADNALKLLQVMMESRHAMSLSEIAKGADMTPSAAHRYLTSFVKFGMAHQEPHSSRYELGDFAVRLGLAAIGRLNAVEVAGEALRGVRDETNASVFLSIWTELGPTVVRWLDAGSQLNVSIRVGSASPLLGSASGRIYLTYALPKKIEPLLLQELAQRATTPGLRGIPSEEIESIRAEVRRWGLAAHQGERLAGVSSLSAPVFEASGELVACMTLVGIEGSFDARPDGATAEALRRHAQNASLRLGYRPSATG